MATRRNRGSDVTWVAIFFCDVQFACIAVGCPTMRNRGSDVSSMSNRGDTWWWYGGGRRYLGRMSIYCYFVFFNRRKMDPVSAVLYQSKGERVFLHIAMCVLL